MAGERQEEGTRCDDEESGGLKVTDDDFGEIVVSVNGQTRLPFGKLGPRITKYNEVLPDKVDGTSVLKVTRKELAR